MARANRGKGGVLWGLAMIAFGLWSSLLQAQELSAVGDQDYRPLEYLNRQGEPSGYDIDVLQLVQKQMQEPIRVSLLDWEKAKAQVLGGQADLLIGTNRSAEREASFDFSAPYLENRSVIFVRRESFHLTSEAELADRRVAVQTGDVVEEYLRARHPDWKFYAYQSQPQALQDLVAGQVDAMVGNYFVGLYWLNQKKVQDEVKVTGKPILTTPYCFAVRKGNTQLLAKLDQALLQVRQQGQLERLQDQWFGENYFSNSHRRGAKFFRALPYVLLAALAILGVSWGAIYVLRSRVRQATRQLEQAGAHFRALIENASDIILVLEKEGLVRYVSPSFEKMLGLGAGQVQKKPLSELVHPQDAEQAQGFAAQVCAKGKASLECRFRCANGSYRVLEALGKDLRNFSAVQGLVVNARDVTERKTAEMELAAEKERLMVTLRSIGDGVIAAQVDGTVAMLNGVAEKLTGWSLSEAQGKKLEEVLQLHEPRTEHALVDPAQKALESSQVFTSSEPLVLRAKDGTERVVSHSTAPIRDQGGEVIGVVLVLRDITAQQKLELELRRAQQIESLGILAGGIAHDFNNLLAAILGNVSLARVVSQSDARLTELLKAAETACRRAASLARQLLTFSAGGAPVRKTASLAEIIEDSAAFVLRGSKTRIEFAFAPALWLAEVDEGQISQVVQNLVLNADQAMPAGGTLRIEADNVQLEADAGIPLAPGTYVRLRFIDQGIGMTPSQLERVFEPYYTTKKNGHGLGLTTSYSIIKRHEGHISVSSEPGQGTTFCIYLPASRVSLVPSLAPSEVPLQGQGRVLLMDDEESVRKVAVRMLRMLHFDVAEAASGEQALELIRRAKDENRPFSIVIMDLTVPGGLGGRETLPLVRALEPGICAIASSGYSNDVVMADHQAYGFNSVLSKPYTLGNLREVMSQAIAAMGREEKKPKEPSDIELS